MNASSDSNVARLKDQLNIDRQGWPSKRDFYTICGQLGHGATGEKEYMLNIGFT